MSDLEEKHGDGNYERPETEKRKLTKTEILTAVAENRMTPEEAAPLLATPVAGGRNYALKVSKKGCVSLYGLNRLPVTLYAQSWLRVLEMSDQIKQFIDDNEDELSWDKDDKESRGKPKVEAE